MSPQLRTHVLLPSFLLALGLAACGDKDEEDDGTGADSGDPSSLSCDGTMITGRAGEATGFVECPDGAVDRVGVETVDPGHDLPSCAGTEEELSCTTDADCSDGPNGTCTSYTNPGWWSEDGEPTTGCSCTYSCTTDADCEGDQACVPVAAASDALEHNRCVTADCRIGSDCESGACGLSTWFDGCGWDVKLTCRADADSCRVDEDCPSGEQCAQPSYYEDEAFSCRTEDCAIGRPLLVADGETRQERARTAPAVARTDWSADLSPALDALSAAQRATLAAHWQQVAAMEHASVASFARFTLQLMAVGAPPDLLAEAHAAGLDEVRHAQLAYGLAGRYGARPVGPGPLSLDGVDVQTDKVAVVRSLVAEACVGETLGVAEVHAALQACEDPAVAEVLAEVHADESRHATLAWRTLRWLVDGDPALRAVARAAAAEALATLVDVRGDAPGLPAHGVLGAAALRESRRHAATGLVRPLLDAVLGDDASPGHEVVAEA